MKFLFLFSLLTVSILYSSVHYIEEKSALPDDPKELYIDVMKRIIANTIYEDGGVGGRPYNPTTRENGKDHPILAHSMIGKKRLDNIHYCVEEVLKNNIPGDVIETGAWRGGATILMRAILKAYGDTSRKVWVADSFAGLPKPNEKLYPQDTGLDFSNWAHLAVSLEQVQNNFKKYGLLDNQVVFIKGFFKDTLPTAPIEKLSVLRLDGDLYESTIEALLYLYPKLSSGGFLIVDDFGALPACARAVMDYRALYGIQEPIIPIDQEGIYWQKN